MIELSGKKVLIWGLGEFGGGVAAAKYACRQGAKVTITDLKSAIQLADSLEQLKDYSVQYTLGEHQDSDFAQADVIVVNPAVKFNHPLLTKWSHTSKIITAEIKLFLENCPTRKIIAVTGSAGKSTTTTLIYELLKGFGQTVFLGGNIGQSLLYELENIRDEDFVVLELSSFQLHQLKDACFSPEAAVVTSFFPNHLDWHQNNAHYLQSKQILTEHQQSHQYFIRDKVLEQTAAWPGEAVRISPEEFETHFGMNYLPVEEWLKLPGNFNIQNARLAVAAVCSLGFRNPVIIQQVLQNFHGLPHRMELIPIHGDITFINDSKSTTPESTILALKNIKSPIVLLAGGADKGVDLSQLAENIIKYSACTILMGDTGKILAEKISAITSNHYYLIANSPEEAFEKALQNATSGSTVLLSPGCASFGWFKNFEDRGNRFKEFVLQFYQSDKESLVIK